MTGSEAETSSQKRNVLRQQRDKGLHWCNTNVNVRNKGRTDSPRMSPWKQVCLSDVSSSEPGQQEGMRTGWTDVCAPMRPAPHLTWNCNAIPVPDSCRHLLNKAEERLLMPVVPYHRNRVRHKCFCLVPHCSEKHYVHALVLAINAMPVPGSPFIRHDDPVPLV